MANKTKKEIIKTLNIAYIELKKLTKISKELTNLINEEYNTKKEVYSGRDFIRGANHIFKKLKDLEWLERFEAKEIYGLLETVRSEKDPKHIADQLNEDLTLQKFIDTETITVEKLFNRLFGSLKTKSFETKRGQLSKRDPSFESIQKLLIMINRYLNNEITRLEQEINDLKELKGKAA